YCMKDYLSLSETADYLGKSKETLRRWDNSGKLPAFREPISQYRIYKKDQLKMFKDLIEPELANDNISAQPLNDYKVLELFAGAGGLAIGLEQAGLKCAALNEIDHWAAETLRFNRPNWNVLEGDIRNISFVNLK